MIITRASNKLRIWILQVESCKNDDSHIARKLRSFTAI